MKLFLAISRMTLSVVISFHAFINFCMLSNMKEQLTSNFISCGWCSSRSPIPLSRASVGGLVVSWITVVSALYVNTQGKPNFLGLHSVWKFFFPIFQLMSALHHHTSTHFLYFTADFLKFHNLILLLSKLHLLL